MLPLEMATRLKYPGKIEEAFLNYLKKSGASINQSKTIASQILYHQKIIEGLNSVSFFTGTSTDQDTNINGGFVRPESEHFLIYAIRVSLAERGVIPNTADTVYSPGVLGSVVTDAFIVEKANLSITVNSLRVLKNLPLTEFDGEETDDTIGMFLLDEPILWQGQTELKALIQSNDNIAFSATNLRLEFFGIGLI